MGKASYWHSHSSQQQCQVLHFPRNCTFSRKTFTLTSKTFASSQKTIPKFFGSTHSSLEERKSLAREGKGIET